MLFEDIFQMIEHRSAPLNRDYLILSSRRKTFHFSVMDELIFDETFQCACR